MRIERLGIEHRREISENVNGLDEFISDFTFSNLFLYRGMYDYRIIFDDGPVFIAGTNPVGHNFLTPVTDPVKLGADYIAELMRNYDFLYPIAEKWKDMFDPGRFEITLRSGEMDYLFRVEKLASFKGGKYNRRRNRLKQFLLNNEGSIREFSPADIDTAFDILRKWQDATGLQEKYSDYRQCAEALRWFGQLPLSGRIYSANGGPVGFLLGEPLNQRVFIIHFIKGLPGYQGLYEFMFNSFAASIPEYEYINMEEDMGRVNLRKTKSSYIPEFLVKKYRVGLK
ncbi:MAG: phosphatidylglycerol lysyltransferase domain-containing protein [Syntrophaceae bacterium]